ncbi:hypothetical protein AB0F52_03905 [Amycolatopsis sp. NPDC024027]|uniref:hypothetical protein n=1 Tax=Amycolatopsis sp. NPDC024027 TaxID=3154327 RepID=UPI0033FA78B4
MIARCVAESGGRGAAPGYGTVSVGTIPFGLTRGREYAVYGVASRPGRGYELVLAYPEPAASESAMSGLIRLDRDARRHFARQVQGRTSSPAVEDVAKRRSS